MKRVLLLLLFASPLLAQEGHFTIAPDALGVPSENTAANGITDLYIKFAAGERPTEADFRNLIDRLSRGTHHLPQVAHPAVTDDDFRRGDRYVYLPDGLTYEILEDGTHQRTSTISYQRAGATAPGFPAARTEPGLHIAANGDVYKFDGAVYTEIETGAAAAIAAQATADAALAASVTNATSISGVTTTADNALAATVTNAANVATNTTAASNAAFAASTAQTTADDAGTAAAAAQAKADLIEGRVVASVADLVPVADGERVTVQGFAAAGDAGEPWAWVYHTANRPAVATGDGRPGFVKDGPGADDWFEAIDKSVANLRRFGAKSDWNGVQGVGATGTDNGAVITAISAAATAQGCPVYVPAGRYRSSTSFDCGDDFELFGDGRNSQIYNDTTYAVNAMETNRVTVRHVALFGAEQAFSGMRFYRCTFSSVDYCWVNGFTIGVQVEQNHGEARVTYCVATGNVGGSVADISVDSRKSTIHGNWCLSECSEGINFGNSASDGGDQPALATVTSNICIGHSRHGILASYGDDDTRSTISNNICIDNGWTGIYCQTAVGNGPAGNVTISNNVLANNGGNQTGNVANAGLYFNGRIGAVLTGNVIIDSGYAIGGLAHQSTASGIWLQKAENCVVNNNKITGATNAGIGIYGGDCKHIRIDSNVVKDCLLGNIRVRNSTTASSDIWVTNNNLISKEFDVVGMQYDNETSNVTGHRIHFHDNEITSEFPSATANGFEWEYLPQSGSFKRNTVTGFNRGVSHAAVAGTAADRHIGEKFVIDDNEFYDITDNAFQLKVSPTGVGFIGHNKYTNVTSVSDTTRAYVGRLESGIAVLHGTSSPTIGAWSQGDRMTYTNPVAAGKIGTVCVTAGSPGTWKEYGAIDP